MANSESSTQCNLKSNHICEEGKGLTLIQKRAEETGAHMVKVTVLWGTTLCNVACKYQHYTGTWCLLFRVEVKEFETYSRCMPMPPNRVSLHEINSSDSSEYQDCVTM
jgi:hypothetical protein